MLKKLILSSLLVLGAACGVDGPELGTDHPSTNTAELGRPPLGGTPIGSIPWATAAERSALEAELQRRLGSGWTVVWNGGNQIHPYRLSGPKPTVHGNKSPAEIEAIASRFLAAHADLVGLTPADVQAQTPSLKKSVGDFWKLSGSGVRQTPGLEQFPSFTRNVNITVDVWTDGTVFGLSATGQELPPLAVDTTPVLPADDIRVLTKVIGHEVSVSIAEGTFPVPPFPEVGRGPVLASDVKEVRLDILKTPNPAKQATDLRLIYIVEVTKFKGEFKFWIDANTGDLVAAYDEAVVFDD